MSSNQRVNNTNGTTRTLDSNNNPPNNNYNNYRNSYRDNVDDYYYKDGNRRHRHYGERRYFSNHSSYNGHNSRDNYVNDDRRARSYRDKNGDRLRSEHCFAVLLKSPTGEKSEPESATNSTKTRDNKPSNKQLQSDEITALKSIFDETVLTVDDRQMSGRFVAEPKLTTNPFYVVYNCREIGKIEAKQKFIVEHLPPIELYFEFSDSYPGKSQPLFLLSCKWLQIQELDDICGHLENLWRESKSEILYTWFSFLQNDVLNWLGVKSELDITSIINLKPMWKNETESLSTATDGNNFAVLKKTLIKPMRSTYGYRHGYYDRRQPFVMEFRPQLGRGHKKFDQRAVCDLLGFELINHIQCYDETQRKHLTDKTYFLCNICFSQNLGADCVAFTCGHTHCRNCISRYFESLVRDGAVNSLKCPEIKCETLAPPNMIRQLISEELYKRFDQLKLATIVATTEDAHYCPRKLCGSVVMGEPDSSLAHCQACSFAFCKHCKYSYHGIDPCQLFRDEKQRRIILDKYRHSSGSEKSRLEKQYGKKQLAAALNEYESEKWIDEMSKRCPHCKASIEKSDGCNKMLCWRCNTYFCWLCLSHLNSNSPYSHYNDPQSKCYNLLFQGIDLTEDFDVMFI